jgi:hypothetical protein
MSANKSEKRDSIGHAIKETADCIYERLRFQVNRIGSASGSTSHIFFVFGASVGFDSIECFFSFELFFCRVI